MALQHLLSSTANKRPTPAAMSDGQVAINSNTASPGLFFKDSAGALIKVGPVHVGTTAPNASPASGGETGNTVGEQWLDTTGSTYVFKVWDGSAWRSETGTFVDVNGDVMTGALVMDNQQQIRFRETTANGTNYIALQAPASVASDKTITLPDVNGTVVTTGDTGTVTSTMLLDGTIADADISASAEIAVSKLADGAARQLLQTDAAGTGVEWTSNVDVPGTLDVTSTATFDSIASHPLGSAAAPTITFTGDTNTGIYSPGADQVAVATNGTRRLVILSDGKVGLGAASVLQQGSGVDGGSAAGVLELYNGGTGNTTLENTGAFPIVFKTNGSERLRITAAGLVGVGTGGSTPNGTLETKAAAGVAPFVASGPSSEYARVDSSGRLLIGTATALSNVKVNSASGNNPTLQLQGQNDSYSTSFSVTNASGSSYGPAIALNASRGSQASPAIVLANGDFGFLTFNGYDGTNYIPGAHIAALVDGTPGANDMPGRLVFATTADGASSPTERMRISNAGAANFFASTTNVIGAASNQGAGTTYYLFYGSNNASSTTTGTTCFLVYTNGNVQNTNNSYAAISDIKLKENIVDSTSQWSDIKALQVRKYNFKQGQTHTQIGLIAQEVELVSPGLVIESPDRDAEGNDLGTVTKSVNYSVLYVKAVKALQEAMERIEVLEARLDAANR